MHESGKSPDPDNPNFISFRQLSARKRDAPLCQADAVTQGLLDPVYLIGANTLVKRVERKTTARPEWLNGYSDIIYQGSYHNPQDGLIHDWPHGALYQPLPVLHHMCLALNPL
jgi:hypothetical protein